MTARAGPDANGLRHFPGACVMLAVAFMAGCHGPTRNPWKLKAIRAEADQLIAATKIRPPHICEQVRKSEWPAVIASLEPEYVAVCDWGLAIWIKPYFDGGWGYDVPRSGREPPMPAGCYSEPGEGVFWHGPC